MARRTLVWMIGTSLRSGGNSVWVASSTQRARLVGREKALERKLAERDAALVSMAPIADAAVSAGLVSDAGVDLDQGGALIRCCHLLSKCVYRP